MFLPMESLSLPYKIFCVRRPISQLIVTWLMTLSLSGCLIYKSPDPPENQTKGNHTYNQGSPGEGSRPNSQVSAEDDQEQEEFIAKLNSSPDRVTNVVQNRTTSCSEAQPQESLYGNYTIQWTFRGSLYKGLLRVNGNQGELIVTFFNNAENKTQTILQDMKLYNCTFALVLFGTNPRSLESEKRIYSYRSDNFFFQQGVNGELYFGNCDDQGLCSPIQISEVFN